MATQNVCSFNKYGFCRYQERCRKYHEKNLCENAKCVVRECVLRHPKFCKYLRDYGHCKFGEWCFFSHKLSIKNYNIDNDEIKELNDKLNDLNNKIKTCETNIMDKSNEIEALEKKLSEKDTIEQREEVLIKFDTKIETFEGKLNTMKMCLENKDDYITNLEAKVKDVESKHDNFVKIQEAENIENEKKLQTLLEKLSILENSIIKNSSELLKCTKCKFETHSEQGLKTHITRKHTIISSTGYPKKCELCEKQFNNPKDFKMHWKTHSYKEAKFKCEDCDFLGKCFETMDVHNGKSHTDNFECGLCEKDFGNLEELTLHLNTCEIYRCRRCFKKEISISDIKAHAVRNHNGNGPGATLVDHIKMSRNDSDEVISKEHWHNSL